MPCSASTGRAAAAQQDVNQQALRRWQDHLGVLALAGIESPSAAALADPAALPAGLSPALDAAGQPVPGVAWAVAGNRPVTVLPAETVVHTGHGESTTIGAERDTVMGRAADLGLV